MDVPDGLNPGDASLHGLLIRAGDGDAGAFASVHGLLEPRARPYLRRRGVREGRVSDLFHDSLLRLLDKRHDIEHPAATLSYWYRILHDLSRVEREHEKRHEHFREVGDDGHRDGHSPVQEEQPGVGVQDRIIDFERAFMQLGVVDRDILLRVAEGFSHRKIAARLAAVLADETWNASRVAKRLQRARMSLKCTVPPGEEPER